MPYGAISAGGFSSTSSYSPPEYKVKSDKSLEKVDNLFKDLKELAIAELIGLARMQHRAYSWCCFKFSSKGSQHELFERLINVVHALGTADKYLGVPFIRDNLAQAFQGFKGNQHKALAAGEAKQQSKAEEGRQRLLPPPSVVGFWVQEPMGMLLAIYGNAQQLHQVEITVIDRYKREKQEENQSFSPSLLEYFQRRLKTLPEELRERLSTDPLANLVMDYMFHEPARLISPKPT